MWGHGDSKSMKFMEKGDLGNSNINTDSLVKDESTTDEWDPFSLPY